jgi:hypothetical protein
MVCRRWQKGKLLRERLPLQRLTENRLHRDRSEGGAPRRANSPSSRAARRTDARSGKTRKRGIASASSSRRLHRGLHTYGRRNPASSLEKKSWLCRTFAEPSDGLEPSTPSLPWRFRDGTRVHARSLPTQFLLQIGRLGRRAMRCETSCVSFLMCPFCVHALLLARTTEALSRSLSRRGTAGSARRRPVCPRSAWTPSRPAFRR